MTILESLAIESPKRNHKLKTGWEGFFPYYAGFSESFTRTLLSGARLSGNSVVLDPWNGSGTTTYVASSRGIPSIGFDLNPVMVIVAKARQLASSEADSIQPLGREILKDAEHDLETVPDDPLEWWFTDDTAQIIRAVERSIRRHLLGSLTLTPTQVHFDKLSSLAATNYVALFSMCRELCARFQSSNPTWMRRPKHGERKARAKWTSIERKFSTQLARMARALNACTPVLSRESITADIRQTDTTTFSLDPNTVDLVLTSPPYCTRIDYTAATRVELAILHPLLNQTPADLSRLMTGSTRVPLRQIGPNDAWGPTCISFLDRLRRHPSKASAGYYLQTHTDYFDKIYRSIANCSAALRSDGVAILVVQDSFYKDVHNDLPSIVTEMSDQHGLKCQRREDFRTLRSMSEINPRARKYNRRPGANESVLCFRKG